MLIITMKKRLPHLIIPFVLHLSFVGQVWGEFKNYLGDEVRDIGVNIKSLDINTVIEQGLRLNHDQHLRQFEGELIDLNWKDAYYSFWFPQVDIVMTSSELLSSINQKTKPPQNNFKAPTGTVGIDVKEYSLFNWGKDYLQYQSDKNTYQRNVQALGEQRRELKLMLMAEYFNLITLKKIEFFKKEQLRHASFVYRLNKEKFTLNKIRKQEYLQSRDEFLRAQDEYQEALMNAAVGDERIAYLIGDSSSTRYTLKENIVYKKIFIKQEEAFQMSAQRNPDVLNTLNDVENANINYEIEQKDNLPLPKISLNFGAYRHSFGQDHHHTHYERTPHDGDVDLSASINATWNLVGPGGLFNSRKTARALVTKNMAVKNYLKYKHLTKSQIREAFKKIIHLQSQIEILDAKIETVEKTFDTTLDNYTRTQTSFINIKDSLISMTQTKEDYAMALLAHLQQKITLAKLIGVENLPNDIFETLTKQ